MLFLACLVLPLLACEHLDDDVRTHVPGKEPLPSFLSLEEVARVLSSVDIGASQMGEVHDAVTSSTGNGYDEEYTMQDLFERPGAGVGDVPSKAGGKTYETPLRQLLSEAVKARYGTKASDEGVDADTFLDALTTRSSPLIPRAIPTGTSALSRRRTGRSGVSSSMKKWRRNVLCG